MDVTSTTIVNVGNILKSDAVFKKVNNILSNVQNIIHHRRCDEPSPSKASPEANEVERNSSSEARMPFLTRSKREVFEFSEDEDDTLQIKSAHRNINKDGKRFDLSDEDYNNVEDLVSRLNTFEIDNSDVDDFLSADSEPKIVEDNKKFSAPFEKKNCPEKLGKVKNRLQKENIDVTKIAKSVKSKTSKVKRKDSFVVSDDSSFSDDATDITIYHQILTKDIRADVRRMTPKPRRSRKKVQVPTYDDDDRMFAAYIITKRSGSEYSSSDDEVTQVRSSPSFRSNPNLKDEKSEVSDDDSSSVSSKDENSESDSSSDSLLTSIPKKKNSPPVSRNRFRKFSWISSDDDSSSSDEKVSKIKDESMSFLKSLSNPGGSGTLHPDAEKYIKSFKKRKEELASRLFKMFNEEVFKNQLPSDLKIEWNARLTSCAGQCRNGRDKTVIGPNKECVRISRIVLSTKILESADRLRDTLIHEMCHAATWIIDRESGGHGPLWKSWAAKAMKTFPELPSIKRCHNYSIKTKYKYRCVRCGYTIGRHSKSLKMNVQLCGYCHGVFELVVENPTKSNTLPKFALFVKENYSKIKSEKPDLKHKDIMKELSENFASTKISN